MTEPPEPIHVEPIPGESFGDFFVRWLQVNHPEVPVFSLDPEVDDDDLATG